MRSSAAPMAAADGERALTGSMRPTLVPQPERWLNLAASSRDASGLEHTPLPRCATLYYRLPEPMALVHFVHSGGKVWLRTQLSVADNKQYLWDSRLSVTRRAGCRGICCPRDVRSDPASWT